MRPTTLLPQIQGPRKFNLDQIYQGAYLIFWPDQEGRGRRQLAPIVNDLFGRWQTIDGGLALLAIYAFAFQILLRLLGLHRRRPGDRQCLGIELALNFNLPYFSTSPQEFWGRWHISLSKWLQDYLFIPLGGSRGGTLLTYRNLMLTMIIGGLWHGAAWTFIVWGTYQGVILVGHRLAKPLLAKIEPTQPIDQACWKAVRIIATFHMVCLGWLIFRSTGSPPEIKVGAYTGMEQLLGMLRAIVDRPAIPASAYLLPVMITIIPLVLVQVAQYVTHDLDIVSRTPWYVRSVFYTMCFYAFVLAGEFGGSQFIYFQF